MQISRTVRAGMLVGSLAMAGWGAACSRNETSRCATLQNPAAIQRLSEAFIKEGSANLTPYQERIASAKLTITLNQRISDPAVRGELDKFCSLDNGVKWAANPYGSLSLETMKIDLNTITEAAKASKVTGTVTVTVGSTNQAPNTFPIEKEAKIAVLLNPVKIDDQTTVPLPNNNEGAYFIRLESSAIGSFVATGSHQYLYLPAAYSESSGAVTVSSTLKMLADQSEKAGWQRGSVSVIFRDPAGVEYVIFDPKFNYAPATPVATVAPTVTPTATRTAAPPATVVPTATRTAPPATDDPCKANPSACL